MRRLSYSIKAYANLPHLNERKKYLLSVKNCLCQNRNMFPTCQGNVVHTTASLPHFTVPTGARLTRNIAQSSAVGTLCVRLHGGVWGGLCPPLSSPGRLLLGNLCKFGCGAHRCAAQLRFLRRRCVFAATIQHHFRILPPGLGTLSTATQHNHYSIPPKYKYIILPLKCAAFNLSKNSGHKKANFRLINKYSNFPHFTFIVQRISFDFLQTLL